jgi:hypothetical protein
MFYSTSCIDDFNFVPATWPCIGWIIFLTDPLIPFAGEYYAEWYEDGLWLKWKSNLMFFQYAAGSDYWFYSGNKKQGFSVDTWGEGHAFPGDCYYLKKVKCKDLIFVLGKDMETLKEEARNKPSILKDRSNEALKGVKSEYCERIRQDKAFKAERFEFGDVEEETEE